MMGWSKSALPAAALVTFCAWGAGAGDQTFAVVLQGDDTFSRRMAEELAERLEAGLASAPGQRLLALDQPAQDPRWDRALQRLEAGREAYLNMDTEAAASLLREALDGMQQAGDTLVRAGRQACLDALLTLGAAEIVGGEPARGQATFARALLLEPAAELDPASFPPELVHAFAAVRADIQARPLASLHVFTTPDLARVWVDGRFHGVSPCEVPDLAAGPHFVWVRRLGHEGVGRLVELEGGRRVDLSLRLSPSAGAAGLAPALEVALRGLPRAGAEDLGAWAARLGVDRVLVGRVAQAGAGFTLRVAWLDVAARRWVEPQMLGLAALPAAGSPELRRIISSLLSGGGPVLESLPPGVAQPGSIALRDEARFEAEERPWWERWYVWTGIAAGVIVVAGAIALGVLLSADGGPGSQIVLEF